jgi:hypothetical protein
MDSIMRRDEKRHKAYWQTRKCSADRMKGPERVGHFPKSAVQLLVFD